MKKLIFFAVVALAGCSSEADKVARKYENAKSAGASAAALCDRANDTIRAYLDEGNKEKVDIWAAKARDDCLMSRLSRYAPTR